MGFGIKRCWKILFLCVFSLAVMHFPVSSQAERKVIKLGFVADISGSGFLISLSQKNALELGLEEINSTGGLLGKRVELIIQDSKMKPELGAALAEEMILKDKVDFLIGPSSPAVALAISKVAREHKKLIYFHSANNEKLTTEEGHRYLFQVVPNTYMEGQAAASFFFKKGFKKIAIIGPDVEFGRSEAAAFRKRLSELNPAIQIVKELWPPIGEPNYLSHITALLSAGPEAVFSILWGGDLATFIRQAKPKGLFQRSAFLGLIDYDLLKGMGKDMIPNLYGFDRAPFYAIQNPQMKSFVQKFKTRTGEYPSSWAILAYDGLNALRKAVEKAKSLDTEKVIEALEGLKWDSLRGPLYIRPFDHLANGGIFLGTTFKDPKYSFFIMKDVQYLPGEDYWHLLDDIKALRK
jgi:branched-chain amino acid transport system substrate-binding protein